MNKNSRNMAASPFEVDTRWGVWPEGKLATLLGLDDEPGRVDATVPTSHEELDN